MNEKIDFGTIVFIIVGIIVLCILSTVLRDRQRSEIIRELDQRYAGEYTRAAETIGRLEEELGRERELNRRLRENNYRAREIAEGLTGTTERNVRNLQDAVVLIGEIRTKVKVLADFYDNSDTGGGGD